MVRNLYSIVILIYRQVDDVPPWAGKPKKGGCKNISKTQPKTPKVDSTGIVETSGEDRLAHGQSSHGSLKTMNMSTIAAGSNNRDRMGGGRMGGGIEPRRTLEHD